MKALLTNVSLSAPTRTFDNNRTDNGALECGCELLTGPSMKFISSWVEVMGERPPDAIAKSQAHNHKPEATNSAPLCGNMAMTMSRNKDSWNGSAPAFTQKT